MSKVVIKNFPMPPSINESYKSGVVKFINKHGGRSFRSKIYGSTELYSFKNKALLWGLQNKDMVTQAEKLIQIWIKEGYQLKTDFYFIFPKAKILTTTKKAKNKIKRNDADNRLKAARDALKLLINVDDSNFTTGVVEIAHSESEEKCVISISKTRIRQLAEIMNSLAV